MEDASGLISSGLSSGQMSLLSDKAVGFLSGLRQRTKGAPGVVPVLGWGPPERAHLPPDKLCNCGPLEFAHP